jgi:copper(I)-binding protein
MKKMKFALWGMALFGGAAFAQNVSDAWVRPAVRGQMATGAFMNITAQEASKLMSVTSPVAGVVEIHEMKMDKDVMKMAALTNGLELPAGKTVQLQPGGYHIMLMDLKQPLTLNAMVPMTLTFVDTKGQKTVQELKLPVRAMAPQGHHHH